jgi:hypothetical protein
MILLIWRCSRSYMVCSVTQTHPVLRNKKQKNHIQNCNSELINTTTKKLSDLVENWACKRTNSKGGPMIVQRQEFILKLTCALMMFGSESHSLVTLSTKLSACIPTGPSHCLRMQIQATAHILKIKLSCMYLPYVMLILFDDGTTGTSSIWFIQQGSMLNSRKLDDTFKLYWNVSLCFFVHFLSFSFPSEAEQAWPGAQFQVIHNTISISRASHALNALIASYTTLWANPAHPDWGDVLYKHLQHQLQGQLHQFSHCTPAWMFVGHNPAVGC